MTATATSITVTPAVVGPPKPAAAPPPITITPALVDPPKPAAAPSPVTITPAVVRPSEPATTPTPAGPGLRNLVAAAVALVVLGLLAMAGLDQRVATVGEALLAAGAAVQPGAALTPLSWPDAFAAPQIAAIDILLAVPGPASIADDARTTLLVVGIVGCLLLWTVARRIGLSGAAAALAVVLCGLPAVATGLFGSVDAGALAALWLTVAAALAGRSREATLMAVGATVIAALTVPLAAVGPLVMLGYALSTGAFSGGRRRAAGRFLGLLPFAAAGFVAARVTGWWPTATDAWVGSGLGGVPTALLATVLATGAAVAGPAWLRTPRLRPAVTAAIALLACAALPGPHVATALLLVLPVLAVLAAAVLDELSARARPARHALLAALLVAGAVGSGPLIAAASAPAPDRSGLTIWVEAQLDPGTALQVDPLTGAQLLRDGIPRTRLLPQGAPVPPGTLSVVALRPGAAPAAAPIGAHALLTVPDGPGGGPTSVLELDPGADLRADGRALQARLAGNPALTLTPAAAQALRDGAVDQRLATALSGLTTAHRLTIADFAAVAGEPADAPRRIALITDVDGASASVPGVTDLVQRWLVSQLPSYRPAVAAVERGVLVVRYHAPSPLGPPRP